MGYQRGDEFYERAQRDAKRNARMTKNKKRLESDADYLKNKSLESVDLEEMEMAMAEEDSAGGGERGIEVDLARYYGLEGVGEQEMNVDHVEEGKLGVVYELKHDERD